MDAMKNISFVGTTLALLVVIGAFMVPVGDAHAYLDYYAQTGGSSYGSSYGSGYYNNSYGYYNNYYGYGNYRTGNVDVYAAVYPSYYGSGTRGNVGVSYYGSHSSLSFYFGF